MLGTMMDITQVPQLNGILSNVCGSISIACWVILLLPQLLEQWRLKSADGVALGFILMWFFGDLANLFGSIIGKLRPSVILVALWFCFSDALLLSSYYYYKRLASNKSQTNPPIRTRVPSPVQQQSSNVDAERSAADYLPANDSTPLLQEDHQEEGPTISQGAVKRSSWLLSTGLPAIFVIVVATLSYFISDSAPFEDPPQHTNSLAQFLGYFSAVLYLGARIPQIIQNHKRRSVEGLSIGFFALSVLGNLTYALQVIVYRSDRPWLITYAPWLLGSLGTIAEDVIILMQFHVYKKWN